MNDACIFCQIVAGKIPADIVYENEWVMAFRDIQPAAPKHVLVIPRAHIASLTDLDPSIHQDIWLHILQGIQTVAKTLKLDETGYRVINNIGEHGGQTVGHLHVHVMGGRQMTWPPG